MLYIFSVPGGTRRYFIRDNGTRGRDVMLKGTILGPTHPPLQWVPAANCLDLQLIAPPCLLLRLRMYSGIPLSPPYAFMTCTRQFCLFKCFCEVKERLIWRLRLLVCP